MAIGILLGFGCAFAHSVSYILSRLYVLRREDGAVRLLVLGHVIMGAFSCAMLPFFPLDRLPPIREFLLPLLGTSLFYLLGQVITFFVLRKAEASRVSPLLGLKIVFLAMIAVLVLGNSLSGIQWVAVGLSVAAAILLSSSGGKLPRSSIAGITLTCFVFCLSDLSIPPLAKALEDFGRMQAVFLSVFLCYVVCGAIGLALLPWSGAKQKGDWRWALPWALAWLAAMLFLFGCFDQIGVIFGNILQATRGIMSVALGVAVAALGHVRLEQKVSRGVLVRRIAAAVLMFAAIALYSASPLLAAKP